MNAEVGLCLNLKVTPVMAAGVADRLSDLEDNVKLINDAPPKPDPRGS